MRVVVTGHSGQVARSLHLAGLTSGVEVVCVGRPELDLAEPSALISSLLSKRADVIVNAAAYTFVDKAEEEPDIARAVNALGAEAAAEAARIADVPIIQISTDYVFDGSLGRPYTEEDDVAPLGVYGRTKNEGELRVARTNPRHVILRTSWVYSPFGRNFVKTMLRLASEREEVSVVSDQVGCPTAAIDIAYALLLIARYVEPLKDADSPLFGTFHLTGRGQAAWADVAEAAFARSASLGGPTARVKRISTADYPTPARRPVNSALDGGKLLSTYGISLPPWRTSLDSCVTGLLAENPRQVA